MSDLGGVSGFYDFKESSKMLKDSDLSDMASGRGLKASAIFTVSLLTLRDRDFEKISKC